MYVIVLLLKQEDKVDLVTTIMGATFYRKGAYYDYISDYVQPSPYAFKKIYESFGYILMLFYECKYFP